MVTFVLVAMSLERPAKNGGIPRLQPLRVFHSIGKLALLGTHARFFEGLSQRE
jgi:hypothetical protein